MRIFQRYHDPLKIARIRQYLDEGARRDYLPVLAEAVPGLVHTSLFLFFVGLADFFLSTYPTVGRSTLGPIVLCALLYIIFTVAPVMNSQSSYRTPCSPLVWNITRSLRIRPSGGRFGFTLLPLSSNMAEGQMQLAMKKSEARKRRDGRAIRWLIDNLTDDIQDSESLTLGILGSFESRCGIEVWKEGRMYGVDKVYEVTMLLCETCRDRRSFKSDGEWRVRSRVCTEAIALFVFFMDADIAIIRNLWSLLSDIGSDGGTREVSRIASNQTFAIRWTCLSLAANREMLKSAQLQRPAADTLSRIAALHPEDDLTTPYEGAPRCARRIDEQFATAWNHVERLRQVPSISGEEDQTKGKRREVLPLKESELIPILEQVTSMERLGVDASLFELQQQIDTVTHDLIRNLPGVFFDDFPGSTTAEHAFDFLANPIRPQLIYFSKLLRGLCGVDQEWNSQRLQDMVEKIPSSLRSVLDKHRLMERQVWRLEDLRIGGAFGFTFELYFLSITRILSTFTFPLKEIHKTICVNTFRVITYDWQKFKDSIGTLQIILNLAYDITFQDRGIFSNVKYPDYVKTELLELLRRMSDGQGVKYLQEATAEIWRDDLIVFDPQFQFEAASAIQGQPPG